MFLNTFIRSILDQSNRAFVIFLFFSFLGYSGFSGVSGYSNVGNGSTKFTGSEAGTISVTTSSATSFDAIIRNTSMDDFTFECSTVTANSITTAGKGGVIFRYTNSSNYYAVTNHWDQWATGNYIIRLKNSNLSGFNSTGDLGSYSSSSSISSLKIVVAGSSIEVHVNGVLRISVTNSAHSSGSVGFAEYNLWNWESASWAGVSWTETTLPVDLLNFNATEKENNEVELNWTTATEINNDYFIVEKSWDAYNWKTIGEVNGHGYSESMIKYSFSDIEGCDNKCYYRLTQVDFDGTKKVYKSIVFESSGNLSISSELNIYPIPLTLESVVNYRIHSSGEYQLLIYSQEGKLIYQSSILGEEGSNYLKFSNIDLATGVYIFQIHGMGLFLNKRVVK